MTRKIVDKTRNNNSDMENNPPDEKPVIKKGVLNPQRTEPAKGEIGTQADVYKYSGLSEIEGKELPPHDEEDDTRLGSV